MTNLDKNKTINKAIRFAKKLNGIKYACWKPSLGFKYEDWPPFWKVNEKVPKLNEIKKYGLCCTGLANLVRRYLNLQVPGNVTLNKQKKSIYTGTTSAWFSYLKKNKRLEKIDFIKNYGIGVTDSIDNLTLSQIYKQVFNKEWEDKKFKYIKFDKANQSSRSKYKKLLRNINYIKKYMKYKMKYYIMLKNVKKLKIDGILHFIK